MIADFKKANYRFLSNFHTHRLFIGECEFSSVEQYYQSQKASTYSDYKLIIGEHNPGMCRRLGRSIKLAPEFEYIKLDVMFVGLKYKFFDSVLNLRLQSTFPHVLVEGNYHRDAYWGYDFINRCGFNVLGQMLMYLRMQIMSGIGDRILDLPTPSVKLIDISKQGVHL